MSLKYSWQLGRQQRQLDAAQRHQTVQQTLLAFGQARQLVASQLHSDLQVFCEGLVQQDQVRRADFQVFQAELQQFHQSIQFATQELLQESRDRRQATAAQLTQDLQDFVQSLRLETAELLSATAADRMLMAQQIAQDLQSFRDELQTSVQALRQQNQTHLAILKVDTQDFLDGCAADRQQISAQLADDLALFMEALRSGVQDYLGYVEEVRRDRAEQLQHDLQQSRMLRQADVQAMFDQFAVLRSNLTAFRQSLHQQVWGNEVASAVSSKPTMPTVQTGTATTKPAQTLPHQTKPSTAQPAPRKPSAKSLTNSAASKNVAPGRTTAVKGASPKSSKPRTPARSKVASLQTVAPASNGLVTRSIATQPEAAPPAVETVPPVTSVPENTIPFEKEVYTFLHESQGSRLTQIESALGINRFQAVDALRSLIKKGLITQRDRMYLTQEMAEKV